jgi:hypothetical protein
MHASEMQMRQHASYKPDSLTCMILETKEYHIVGSTVITAINLIKLKFGFCYN